MIWSWLHRHPVAVDVSVVAVLALATVTKAAEGNRITVAVLLNLAATLALLWRRRWPFEVVAIVGVAAATIGALGLWLLPLPLAVALYTLASTRDRRLSGAVGILSVVAMAATLSAGGQGFGDGAARVVFVIAAWLLGDSVSSPSTRRRSLSAARAAPSIARIGSRARCGSASKTSSAAAA